MVKWRHAHPTLGQGAPGRARLWQADTYDRHRVWRRRCGSRLRLRRVLRLLRSCKHVRKLAHHLQPGLVLREALVLNEPIGTFFGMVAQRLASLSARCATIGAAQRLAAPLLSAALKAALTRLQIEKSGLGNDGVLRAVRWRGHRRQRDGASDDESHGSKRERACSGVPKPWVQRRQLAPHNTTAKQLCLVEIFLKRTLNCVGAAGLPSPRPRSHIPYRLSYWFSILHMVGGSRYHTQTNLPTYQSAES